MFLTRVFGRTLFAAAKSEASATAAAGSSMVRHNPLDEFFEADRNAEDEKPIVYGRGWKASELRLKSWDNLQKLWYVLLKEKNMLMTQRQMLNAQNLRFPNPERIPKVRKSIFCWKEQPEGDKIQPSISAELKRKFIPLLKEGHIIIIKKFQVLENKPNFQSANVKHEKRIDFDLATKMFLAATVT
ncbi:hypothetical protein OROHE_008496 [Orobanche hederae]